jgi:hypothetical protein
MSMALDRIVPESMPWLHTDEGPEYVPTCPQTFRLKYTEQALRIRIIVTRKRHRIYGSTEAYYWSLLQRISYENLSYRPFASYPDHE